MRTGLKIFLLFIFVSVAFSVQASAQTYNFTTCGAEGRYGPSQSQCDSAYSGTDLEGEVNIVGEGIQEWTVPDSGEYRITAAGAQGGTPNYPAGEGGVIQASLQLEQNDVLRIAIGQQPDGIHFRDSEPNVGGGGGSFIAIKDKDGDQLFDGQYYYPLLIAGGGGGFAHSKYSTDFLGGTATYGKDANGESDSYSYSGGEDGLGGSADGGDHGGGGAGWLSKGTAGNAPPQPFTASNDALVGAEETRSTARGGFGGGGHAGSSGAGGGGGYSGGGSYYHYPGVAGGGGSFIYSNATEVATSDGNWDTTGNEPHEVYTGSIDDLSRWSSGHGYVKIELVESGTLDFCNFRGPVNECIMNQTNELSSQQYNVSSIFESRSNAVFEAFNGVATLNLTNSSRISGLWKGNIQIRSESPRLKAGASFRPQGERIVIGE